MALKNLKEISVTNGLKDEVSNVTILYCESTKSIHNILNIVEGVDVETSKNILWSRYISLHDIVIPPSKTHKISAKQICFGENDGFWQLYFTYKGSDYKLERNDCEITLSPDCNQQDLNVHLSSSLKDGIEWDIKSNFQISSIEKDFKVVPGKPIMRGINVRLVNQLDQDIDYVNVIFSEGNTSQKEIRPYCNKFEFEKTCIQSNDALQSSDALSYNCFGSYEHYLKISFSSGKNCYEIECDKQKYGLPIKLNEMDYGNALDIVVNREGPSSQIFIEIKTHSETKNVPAITESLISRKSKINDQLLKIQKVSEIKVCVNDLITSLKKLPKDPNTSLEGKKLKEESDLKVYYPTWQPKSPFQEITVEGYKFKIDCKLMTSSIKPIVENVIANLEALKEEWNNLNILLDYLVDLLETFDTKKDIELHEIAENVRTIRSMHTIDILCNVLILSGLDEKRLTFFTSKSETAREISIDVEHLVTAIEEELNLWELSTIPTDNKGSGSLKAKNEKIFKKFIAYQNEFLRLFELFALVREELVDSLRKTASELHCYVRKVTITTITSSSVGAIGAGFAIAGLVLAPFTAGASLAMTVGGLGAGVTSGVVGVGAAVVDGILTQKCVDSVIPLATNDQYICNILFELILKLKILRDSKLLSTFPENDSCFKEHFIKYHISNAFAIAGSAAVKTGVQLAKTAAFKFGTVALSLIFDITTIVFRSIKLSRGGCSEFGYKLETDALLLALELDDWKKRIEELTKKYDRPMLK